MNSDNIDRNNKMHPLMDTLKLFSEPKDIDTYKKAMKIYCIALNNQYNQIMQDFRKDFHKLSARVMQHDIADKIKLPLEFLEEYSRAHISDDDIAFITRENNLNDMGSLVWDRVSSRLISQNQSVIKNHADFIRMIEHSHIDILKLNMIYLRCDSNDKVLDDKNVDTKQWIKATMDVDSSYIKKFQDACLNLFEAYTKLDNTDAEPTLNESTMFNDIAENYLKKLNTNGTYNN